MTRYLCISVTLLDPWFHGKADGEQPEWPPSPLRLFQALLAGARTGSRQRDWSDGKAGAFRWLEQREPPEILAPKAHQATSYTLSVPNNDSNRLATAWAEGKTPAKSAEELRTLKVVLPYRLLDGQTLHYLWPIADDQWRDAGVRAAADILSRDARHLPALGWGIDMAVGDGRVLTDDQAAALPGVRWRPWPGLPPEDGAVRRVPTKGTLDDLEHVYRSFVSSISGKQYIPPHKPSIFDRVSYRRLGDLPPRPYAAFDLVDDQGNRRPFRQVDATLVAAMVRHVACQAAQGDAHVFPGGSEQYVAGHVGDLNDSPPRFSYLPLPTIGHPHADGMIRRVLIAEPFGGAGIHAEWAGQRLRNREIIDGAKQARAVLVAAGQSDAVVRAYLDPAVSWSSVTPVILPGFDDRSRRKAEVLFLKAVEQAGLPVRTIESLSMRPAPYHPGSQHPRLYRRPKYLEHLPAPHACLRFREPIPGPLAIGAGRHCGLGIFAAEKQP